MPLAVLLLLQYCAPLLAQDSSKVRLAYSAFSISFLNIFVARDAGMFRKHGLDAALIQMADPLPVVKDMQEYFDLAYNLKQIPAPINVAAANDYSLLDQVLAGK